MSKLIKVCVNGHEYKADNNMFTCPKCEEKLNFKVIEEVKKEINPNSRSELNSSLPKMPWFNEIKDNNPDVTNSGKEWSFDEVYFLKELYEEYGEAEVKIWKDIAENIFERSIYAIEHTLRYIVADLNLEEIFS